MRNEPSEEQRLVNVQVDAIAHIDRAAMAAHGYFQVNTEIMRTSAAFVPTEVKMILQGQARRRNAYGAELLNRLEAARETVCLITDPERKALAVRYQAAACPPGCVENRKRTRRQSRRLA